MVRFFFVGWVERSDTQQCQVMGIALLHPSCRAIVGRNNQRALRRMGGTKHPVQCTTFIAQRLIRWWKIKLE
jgi:hypothetical protein